jgi:hypothetical protein
MVSYGATAVKNFITLGTSAQKEVFNEKKQIYEYVVGDNSMLCLLYGVITLVITVVFILILTASVKSAYETQKRKELNKPIPNFIDDLKLSEVFRFLPAILLLLISFNDRNGMFLSLLKHSVPIKSLNKYESITAQLMWQQRYQVFPVHFVY